MTFFYLNDGGGERIEEGTGVDKTYMEIFKNVGFNKRALEIQDGTEIFGHFQSEKYYSNKEKEEIKKWYTFKEDKIYSVKEKYKHINFHKSVGLHLRLADKKQVL